MTDQRFTREQGGPPGARETRWTWLLLIPQRRPLAADANRPL